MELLFPLTGPLGDGEITLTNALFEGVPFPITFITLSRIRSGNEFIIDFYLHEN